MRVLASPHCKNVSFCNLRVSFEKSTEMLQFDIENETETIRNYRERVWQCEELAEYAMGEQICKIKPVKFCRSS
uniref:Uncharacterized protein n=1 Tax=mine drainage metagenome TaxID=410659 RepID=E6QK29_9ZZZZ